MYIYSANGYAIGYTYQSGTYGCFTINRWERESGKPYDPISTESKTHAEGDRIHALPYHAVFTERPPIAGTVSYSDYEPSQWDPCPKAGAYRFATFDAGRWELPIDLPNKPLDGSVMEQVVGIAQTKALADLRRSYNNVPLLIVERRETIAMIAKRARMLSSRGLAAQRAALKRYYSTPYKQRAQVSRDIANLHLEMLFGWLPLIGEIEGLCKRLAAEDSIDLTGRGRMADIQEDELKRREIIDQWVGHTTLFFNRLITTKSYVRISARTSIRYRINIAAAQGLRDSGFNPIATAYDLVPLSFLSDFISNLGTFLRAYDPLIGAEFITGSTGTWYEQTVTSDSEYNNLVTPRGVIVKASGGGRQTARRLEVNRMVHHQPPDPSFWMYNNLSLGKAATVAALAIQRYVKPLKTLIGTKSFRYTGPRPKYHPPIRYSR